LKGELIPIEVVGLVQRIENTWCEVTGDKG